MYLEIRDLKKSYGEGSSMTPVLRGITTSLDEGKICAILGPSGSGKSTLLVKRIGKIPAGEILKNRE